MSLEQQIACILHSKHQQILKMPRHEQETVHRPIKVVGSADVTRYAMYSPGGAQHIPVIRLSFT